MESKKGNASLDFLFGPKDVNKPSSNTDLYKYLSTSSHNSGTGKEPMQGKQRVEPRAENSSLTKEQTGNIKDGKSNSSSESAENDGGRAGVPPSEDLRNKNDNPDGSVATKGDFWQGSLYY